MNSGAAWWNRERHASRRPLLLGRNHLKAELRRYFEGQAFVEVECAQLQASPGNETHLHGFRAEAVTIEGHRADVWLHTSPEFAAKKLLAAGETRIFDFARVFRNRESGRLHASEFTMLEWYRAGEGYEALMQDCAAILRIAADVGGRRVWTLKGRIVDPRAEPQRMTLQEAFELFAGIDLMATLSPESVDREALATAARSSGIRAASDDSWSDIFSRVLVEKVEPAIGEGRATVLHEYPWPEAALARRKPGNALVAERFELYACGVELVNAFAELTDAAEQRSRFEEDMRLKRAIYGDDCPLDEDFLAALAHMPEASGAALGFDRLAMLASGAETVAEVQWTPPFNPFEGKA